MKAKKFYGGKAAYLHRKNAKAAFFTNCLCRLWRYRGKHAWRKKDALV